MLVGHGLGCLADLVDSGERQRQASSQSSSTLFERSVTNPAVCSLPYGALHINNAGQRQAVSSVVGKEKNNNKAREAETKQTSSRTRNTCGRTSTFPNSPPSRPRAPCMQLQMACVGDKPTTKRSKLPCCKKNRRLLAQIVPGICCFCLLNVVSSHKCRSHGVARYHRVGRALHE